MEPRQKKVLLLILLVVFLILLTYQIRRIGEGSGEVATLPISSEAAPGERISPPAQQGKTLLPEINLEFLNQPMPAYPRMGRNLFRFRVVKAATPSSPGQRQPSEAQQTAAPREAEREASGQAAPTEQTASASSSQALEELAGFKFLGFARRDSQMIATLKKGDKILVGIRGDIIEEKFTILEIDYQYVELGVVNTSFKQKIPIVNGSF